MNELFLKDCSVEQVCGIYFPKAVDGYIYLLEMKGNVEVHLVSHPDSHPWKEYQGSDRVVARINQEEADALREEVNRLNSEFDAREQVIYDKRKAQAERFESWVESLPTEIFGLTRSGSDLVDEYGNNIISLTWADVAYKDVESIESFIKMFFEEGGFE